MVEMRARLLVVLVLLAFSSVAGFAPRAPAHASWRLPAESAGAQPPKKSYWPPSTKRPQQVTPLETPKGKFWPPSTKQPARPDDSWSPNSVIVRNSEPKLPPAVSPVAAVPSHHSSTSTTSTSTSTTSTSTSTSSRPAPRGPKQRLLSTFSAPSPFVCPASLTPLHQRTTLLGLQSETMLASEEYGSKYRPLRLSPASRGVAAWDLTIKEEQDDKPLWQLNRREQVGSRFFQNPFISAVYERGYRQNFENAGFPGVDKEWAEIRDFFAEAATSEGIVVDLSCGSGFMTRKMLQGGQYGRVVSADLSPTMLQETYRRCMEENVYDKTNRHTLIRADAARLPFPTGSVDCLHAGAALHCWPRLEAALAEVHRVLKPGGRFYASTFSESLPMVVSQRRGGRGGGGFYLFEDKEEVEGFVRGAGFGTVEGRKEGRGCVIVKAVK